MGDELISQHTAVLFDFDEVDGDRRHLGLNDSTEGVCERNVDVGKVEVDVVIIRLSSASAK